MPWWPHGASFEMDQGSVHFPDSCKGLTSFLKARGWRAESRCLSCLPSPSRESGQQTKPRKVIFAYMENPPAIGLLVWEVCEISASVEGHQDESLYPGALR